MNRILILIAATAVSAIAVSSACFAGDEHVYAALSQRPASEWASSVLPVPLAAGDQRAWLQSSLL